MLGLLPVAWALPVLVPAGVHTPFYPASEDELEVPVEAFLLDSTQVTNAEFASFVAEHPRWEQGAVVALFADDLYLSHWEGPSSPGAEVAPRSPVTHVSWHAARAYCEAQNGRLPTVTEWEFAADATETGAHGGRKDEATLQRILDWYALGADAQLRDVGSGPANVYGVHDLHALVWEWTEDFNSMLVASDARESGDGENLRFCGAGALSAADAEDYATFMRSAFQSSLKADYTTSSLGFRCAYSP
ncbi:MAG: formylglycine-generating enzyme family protein [Proteobacteria bacterium]|nr:formylglycine-generating enzyme family protein [Pseudomonadota bacterium]MCP4917388.1 formylglycine-generating enzyme family protein [Pseudomonadota bacterium]